MLKLLRITGFLLAFPEGLRYLRAPAEAEDRGPRILGGGISPGFPLSSGQAPQAGGAWESTPNENAGLAERQSAKDQALGFGTGCLVETLMISGQIRGRSGAPVTRTLFKSPHCHYTIWSVSTH